MLLKIFLIERLLSNERSSALLLTNSTGMLRCLVLKTAYINLSFRNTLAFKPQSVELFFDKMSCFINNLSYLCNSSYLSFRTCNSEKRAFLESKFPTLCSNLAKVAKKVESEKGLKVCSDFRWEPRVWGINMRGKYF